MMSTVVVVEVVGALVVVVELTRVAEAAGGAVVAPEGVVVAGVAVEA